MLVPLFYFHRVICYIQLFWVIIYQQKEEMAKLLFFLLFVLESKMYPCWLERDRFNHLLIQLVFVFIGPMQISCETFDGLDWSAGPNGSLSQLRLQMCCVCVFTGSLGEQSAESTLLSSIPGCQAAVSRFKRLISLCGWTVNRGDITHTHMQKQKVVCNWCCFRFSPLWVFWGLHLVKKVCLCCVLWFHLTASMSHGSHVNHPYNTTFFKGSHCLWNKQTPYVCVAIRSQIIFFPHDVLDQTVWGSYLSSHVLVDVVATRCSGCHAARQVHHQRVLRRKELKRLTQAKRRWPRGATGRALRYL